MYKYVLFDLDGTLTDSKEGIIKSVEYALVRMGETTEGRLEQETIVGPPLITTFCDVFGFSAEKAQKTYEYFQERYSTIGKFENKAFDGIIPLLKKLHDRGVRSFVATSKPQVHAVIICETFGIAPYVEEIAGPVVGGDDTKADIIRRILAHIGSFKPGEAVMVGDRRYDVAGARETGLPVIAVGYGYGNEAERQEVPPDFFAPTVADLEKILLQ